MGVTPAGATPRRWVWSTEYWGSDTVRPAGAWTAIWARARAASRDSQASPRRSGFAEAAVARCW